MGGEASASETKRGEAKKKMKRSKTKKGSQGGALPAGWKEKVDKASGRTYYYHKASKKTQWKRPTA